MCTPLGLLSYYDSDLYFVAYRYINYFDTDMESGQSTERINFNGIALNTFILICINIGDNITFLNIRVMILIPLNCTHLR